MLARCNAVAMQFTIMILVCYGWLARCC